MLEYFRAMRGSPYQPHRSEDRKDRYRLTSIHNTWSDYIFSLIPAEMSHQFTG